MEVIIKASAKEMADLIKRLNQPNEIDTDEIIHQMRVHLTARYRK